MVVDTLEENVIADVCVVELIAVAVADFVADAVAFEAIGFNVVAYIHNYPSSITVAQTFQFIVHTILSISLIVSFLLINTVMVKQVFLKKAFKRSVLYYHLWMVINIVVLMFVFSPYYESVVLYSLSHQLFGHYWGDLVLNIWYRCICSQGIFKIVTMFNIIFIGR